jgi:N-acetyl-anhydromuramyl-L-alanine amidase AmpD
MQEPEALNGARGTGAEGDAGLPSAPPIVEDLRPSLYHGEKGAEYQNYIVLHDTEGSDKPASVIDSWDLSGALSAAHFVIGADGSIHQCVPLDVIAHHAEYGDAEHNRDYATPEDGRDDKAGAVWIGDWAPDYGMNAYSIGIELVHASGSGPYPQAQLEALDALIAYIDAYYDFESTIIDHKTWRSGSSDTSPEFAEHLYSYQTTRKHAR